MPSLLVRTLVQHGGNLHALQPVAARCGASGAYRSCVAAGASRAQGDEGDPFAARARERTTKRDMKAADRTAEWRQPHTNVAPSVLQAIRAEDYALRDVPESEWLRWEAAAARGGKPSRPLSAEHRQKISDAQKGRANNGHVMTPDHKAAISRGMRWMHANPEHKAKRLAGAGKRVNACTRCGESGHNVRTCKMLPPLPQAETSPQRIVVVPEILE